MVKRREKLRICLVASAGGHMNQLLKITESWCGSGTFCITTMDMVRTKLKKFDKVYVVGESNRQHPVRIIKVLAKCTKIVFQERPNVVISTGAAVGCIVCFLCNLLGAKIIWVDSVTNVERLSLSGRMVKYIADLFLVQWPELTDRYKNVEYRGAVI